MSPADIVALTAEGAYFDDKALAPDQPVKFIAWLDLMGTRAHAADAPRTVAINIGLLHDAIARASQPGRVKPTAMGDGAFLVADEWDPLAETLTEALRLMALPFIRNVAAGTSRYAPLCRAGVARGVAIQGTALLAGWQRPDVQLPTAYYDLARGILLGPAPALAVIAEGTAPPFGVAIDASAHGVYGAQRVPDGLWWRWCEDDKLSPTRLALVAALEKHYAWAKAHATECRYEDDARERHLAAWKVYFGP